MLEKMSFVNIMGKAEDIDRVIRKYISDYEIQLEYAAKEITNLHNLESCLEENPYTEYVQRAEKFAGVINLNLNAVWEEIDAENAKSIIESASDFFEKNSLHLKQMEDRQALLKDFTKKIEPFTDLEFDIFSLKDLGFIRFRFGRMPLINYEQFREYVYNQEDILFMESKRDARFVYGVYFVPEFRKDKVDTVLASMNFDRVRVPFEFGEKGFSGTPGKAYNMLSAELEDVEKEISAGHSQTMFAFGINAQDVINAYNTLAMYSEYYDLRKYAAKTHHGYYVFIGWMPEREAARIEADMANDNKVILVLEEAVGKSHSIPPTKLKNNFFVRPFEFFVKMYGLPKYDEIDPTPFVALTYFFLFGVMFGDLGQGAVLSLIGILLYRFKKAALGKILALVGVSSMFFGLMYGSVFGLEELIPHLWLKPAESVNNILFIPVGAGVVLIFITMIFNMINAIRQKNISKLFFGPNGLAGIVFYAGVVGIAVSMFTGRKIIGGGLIVIFIVIPLMLIAFREQIDSYLKRRKLHIEGSVPMMILEMVIELFEVLLTYFTNTVSFVRVGAFALSHAGMMSVVLLLAETGNGLNPVVMVLGNLLVMLMEALVVSIQVLRIEFYELFSRYYEGGGREFIPSSIHIGKDK